MSERADDRPIGFDADSKFSEIQRLRRSAALEAAIRTHRPGVDSADHVVQAARKYLAFLEDREP